MPTVNHVGVSRKIENEIERERLKNMLEKIKPEGMGVIVRTAGEGKEESDFAGEIKFLKRLWEKIKEKADIPYVASLDSCRRNAGFPYGQGYVHGGSVPLYYQ